jgi:hypothetical protein
MTIGDVPRQWEGEYFQACPYSQEGATIPGVVEETKCPLLAGPHWHPFRSYHTAKFYYVSLQTVQANSNIHQKKTDPTL